MPPDVKGVPGDAEPLCDLIGGQEALPGFWSPCRGFIHRLAILFLVDAAVRVAIRYVPNWKKEAATNTPSTIAITRIRELREQHRWTQQDLADRVSTINGHIGRVTVSKIEAGERALMLDEAFAFAAALDVAPVHLFVPVEGEEPIEFGPGARCAPWEARQWIRGRRPLAGQDPRAYLAQVPREELIETIDSFRVMEKATVERKEER